MALFVAGARLPHHPRSRVWSRDGRKLFEQEILRQFAPDGSYSQNSTNYHRLALKLGIIYVLVGERAGQEPSNAVIERLRKAARFLRNMMDDETGWLPNYGANDGANVMALSSCDYRDFRPVLQLAAIVLDGRRIFDKGPWDEEAAWLCGENLDNYPLESSASESMRAIDGGYYCIRQETDFAFIRCHSYTSRPAHADMLHFDLWRDGHNLLADSGSYQYYDPKRDWGVHFASTAAHNTLIVDGQDQMSRLGTFLWGSWTRSRVLKSGEPDTETGLRFVGEHDGYLKRFGVRHKRSILCLRGNWLIVDDAIYGTEAAHDLTVTWHLDPAWKLDEPSGHFRHTRAGLNLFVYAEGAERATLSHEDHYPESARSLYYGDLEPAPVHKVCKRTARSFRFITALFKDEELPIESGVISWQDLRIPVEYSPEPWI
jgi:asparagine synthase (glutamine-hydrolysing)